MHMSAAAAIYAAMCQEIAAQWRCYILRLLGCEMPYIDYPASSAQQHIRGASGKQMYTSRGDGSVAVSSSANSTTLLCM